MPPIRTGSGKRETNTPRFSSGAVLLQSQFVPHGHSQQLFSGHCSLAIPALDTIHYRHKVVPMPHTSYDHVR